MIAIIIAFIISSFSRFFGMLNCKLLGHQNLYIVTYTSHSVVIILIKIFGLFPSAWILI